LSGAQTLTLAEALPETELLAIDVLPHMVDETRRRIREANFGDRVRAEVGDMTKPDVLKGSQDLIWCEGAIYFMGVQAALETWRPLLSESGCVAFTEPIWLENYPPDEIRQWWEAEYPAITDEYGIRAAIHAANFETIGSFPLPADAWWDEYFQPMESRIASLGQNHPNDPVAAEIIAGAEKEIAMFRRFSSSYSYGFFVGQPRG